MKRFLGVVRQGWLWTLIWFCLPPIGLYADTPCQPELVGLIVEDRELGVIAACREGGLWWLPAQELADALYLSLEPSEAVPPMSIDIVTPLGTATFGADELRDLNGRLHVSAAAVERLMATPIHFDPQQAALIAAPPWKVERRGHRTVAAAAVEPDVYPPEFWLSWMHHDVDYAEDDDTDRVIALASSFGGRILGGDWRLGSMYAEGDGLRLSEYAYVRTFQQGIWQLGLQTIRLHPLLENASYAGLQAAFSNRPLSGAAERALTPGTTLIARQGQDDRLFRGAAAPGTIAELRIDGVVYARQLVGHNGEYAFPEIPLNALSDSRIEIALYAYGDLAVPSRIRTIRNVASNLLLPGGVYTLTGGVGVDGNPLDAWIQDDDALATTAGFLQWRAGLTDYVTLEAAAQRVAEQWQAQGGVIWQPASPVVLDAAAAWSHDVIGYDANLHIDLDRWQSTANSQWLPADFYGPPTDDEQVQTAQWRHRAEVSRRIGQTLTLGIQGLQKQDGSGRRSGYLLPFGYWYPRVYFSLRVTPDTEEDYRFEATLRPFDRLSLRAEYADPLVSLDLQYQAYQDYELSLAASWQRKSEEEDSTWAGGSYALYVSRNADWLYQTRLRAGVFQTGDTRGLSVSAQRYVLPGMRLSVGYTGDHTYQGSTADDAWNSAVTAQLSLDFDITQQGIRPARSSGRYQNRGTIAGRVRLPAEAKGLNVPLHDLYVRVGHYFFSTTDTHGNFFVPNLAPGDYVVELSIEKLPITLTPERTHIVARVAAGQTTLVDFVVRPEFGIAGRVRRADGEPLPDAMVQAVNTDGEILNTAITDQFGLYRLDGLPPGRYRLRAVLGTTSSAAPHSRSAGPEREVEVTDHFLFDQDLRIAQEPPTD